MKKLIFIILVLLLVLFGCKTDSGSDGDDDKARFRILDSTFVGIDWHCAIPIYKEWELDPQGTPEDLLYYVWSECGRTFTFTGLDDCKYAAGFYVEVKTQNPDRDTESLIIQDVYDIDGEIEYGGKTPFAITWFTPEKVEDAIIGSLKYVPILYEGVPPASFDFYLIRRPGEKDICSEIYSVDNPFFDCPFVLSDLSVSDEIARIQSALRRSTAIQVDF